MEKSDEKVQGMDEAAKKANSEHGYYCTIKLKKKREKILL